MIFKNETNGFSAQHERNSMENKPASLLMSLGKALYRMPLFICGRQVAWPSGLPVAVAQSIFPVEHKKKGEFAKTCPTNS